jgi:glycosyltransferase involved in cell wall biosynthesis
MHKPVFAYGLISVIIPMYNAEKTIQQALQSIVLQTGGQFEIIIVNDGSTDASLVHAYRFKNANPQVPVVIEDKIHEGVAATRNAGLRLATGNYIAFLDADDEWHPEKTLKQLRVFNDVPDTMFLGCLYKKVPAQQTKSCNNSLSIISLRHLLFQNFFQVSTVLMKRDVFEITGYFESRRSHGEDRHYFLRVSHNFPCLLLHESLINYGNGKRGFGESGLSADIVDMEIAELKNLVYAYRKLSMPLLTCCVAIVFSLLKFMRRAYIVYVEDAIRNMVS